MEEKERYRYGGTGKKREDRNDGRKKGGEGGDGRWKRRKGIDMKGREGEGKIEMEE